MTTTRQETPQIVTDYIEGRASAIRATIRYHFDVVSLPGLDGWALIYTPGHGQPSTFAGLYDDRRNAISDGVRRVGM